MPLYAYQCHDCDATFDQRRPISQADAPATCPTCESANTRRLLSTVSTIGGRNANEYVAAALNKRSNGHRAGCPCCTPKRSQLKIN
jgi:putative FmdB family regulatory protein